MIDERSDLSECSVEVLVLRPVRNAVDAAQLLGDFEARLAEILHGGRSEDPPPGGLCKVAEARVGLELDRALTLRLRVRPQIDRIRDGDDRILVRSTAMPDRLFPNLPHLIPTATRVDGAIALNSLTASP